MNAQNITVLGNPPAIQINSSSDLQNGKYIDHATLNLSYPILSLNHHTELYVRALNANMTKSGSSSTIPVNTMKVSVILPTGGDPEVTLSTTEQRLFRYTIGLIPGIIGSIINTTIRYKMTGGTHLLNKSGSYSVTLVYRYVVD